jgi:hypothetical protein
MANHFQKFSCLRFIYQYLLCFSSVKAICNWSWQVIVGEHELYLEFAILENRSNSIERRFEVI